MYPQPTPDLGRVLADHLPAKAAIYAASANCSLCRRQSTVLGVLVVAAKTFEEGLQLASTVAVARRSPGGVAPLLFVGSFVAGVRCIVCAAVAALPSQHSQWSPRLAVHAAGLSRQTAARASFAHGIFGGVHAVYT